MPHNRLQEVTDGMGTEVNSSATPVAPENLRIETEEDFISLKFGKLENEEQFVVLSEIRIKPGALSDSDDEAKCRCGISRAYYGAFHRAKKFLTEVVHQTISIYGGGAHKEVIKIL